MSKLIGIGKVPQQTTVNYFESVDPSLEGLGSYFAASPIAIAAKKIRESRRSQVVNGVSGDVSGLGTVGVVVGVGLIVLGGALSYQAGKAMAPNRRDENTWGWIGVPMGLLFPLGIGLGIMGAVSNSRK